MTVGKELRSLRKRQGLSLREFGALCGISGDELARYERGEKNPRQANTQKIAAALGEPVQSIRNGFAWVEEDGTDSPEDGLQLLQEGVLQFLRETYGTVEAGTFQDCRGAVRSYYTIGTPPDAFLLYEEDLNALAESISATVGPLAEHMKDIRPETEIQRELLEGLGETLPDTADRRLTEREWASLRELLPPENKGRGRAYKDNRLVLEGILYWMRTGVPWKDLPERFGRARCIYDRLRLWNDMGVWPKVLAQLLALNIISEDEIVVNSTAFRNM